MKNKIIKKRIGAMTIDWFIASFIHIGLLILIVRFGYISELFPKIIMASMEIHSIIYFSIVIMYYLVLEVLTGRTIGKLIFGLIVVGNDGKKPSIGSIFTRNIFRITDQFLSVGSITIFFNKSNKRLGDIVGKTIVIEKKISENHMHCGTCNS